MKSFINENIEFSYIVGVKVITVIINLSRILFSREVVQLYYDNKIKLMYVFVLTQIHRIVILDFIKLFFNLITKNYSI